MTQQNAALVEQSAAASDSLQEQAQALVASMSIFKLGDERQARSAVPATRPPVRPAIAQRAVRTGAKPALV